AAMRRRDPVLRLQRFADAGGDGLLSRVEMDSACGQARLDQPLEAFLELADERHPLVHPEEAFPGQSLRLHCAWGRTHVVEPVRAAEPWRARRQGEGSPRSRLRGSARAAR